MFSLRSSDAVALFATQAEAEAEIPSEKGEGISYKALLTKARFAKDGTRIREGSFVLACYDHGQLVGYLEK